MYASFLKIRAPCIMIFLLYRLNYYFFRDHRFKILFKLIPEGLARRKHVVNSCERLFLFKKINKSRSFQL